MTHSARLELIQHFQTLTLPFAHWTHAAHLTVGLHYVSRYPIEQATSLLRVAIQHYNLHNGIVQTQTRGYHETITVAFARLLAAFVATHPDATLDVVTELALASPLGRPDCLLRYYSKDRLMSWVARSGWLEPDLNQLPDETLPVTPVASMLRDRFRNESK